MNQSNSAFRLSPSALRNRLRWFLGAFALLLFTVYGRLVALELHDGAEYRAVAAEPIVHTRTVPGMRGRILAADGTVLAFDQPTTCLALEYRWLQEPADPRWVRQTVRSRLSAAERRDARRLAAAQQQVLAERRELWRRLATLCGLTDEQWQARAQRIQQHVETISASANSRQLARLDAERRAVDDDPTDESGTTEWPALIGRSIVGALFSWDEPTASQLTVTEELSEHVVFEGLSLEAVAEFESHAAKYPGVKLTNAYQRIYPQGELAAHAVGYLGRVNADELIAAPSPSRRGQGEGDSYTADDWIGRSGIERQYENILRACRGVIADRIDAHGKATISTTVRQPVAGRDVVLSFDPALQRTAQLLLDQALARRLSSGDGQQETTSGGAVVVMNIENGAILAATAAPRFDPNTFVQSNRSSVDQWLNDPARPLLDRTVQMALPPGSVFKIVSAAALLDAGVDPQSPVDCQGYLHQPDALRCAVFRRYGVGHGPVTLAEALARSCNVYFFHHAEQFGGGPLMDWARRFELGRATGIDLPGEAAGILPAASVVEKRPSPITLVSGASIGSGVDSRLLAIGQGAMTATPLQIVRVVAAIANGGFMVAPHVGLRVADDQNLKGQRQEAKPAEKKSQDWIRFPPPRAVSGLNYPMREAIERGLRRAVNDPEGTAHATVELNEVAIAGKTGTAETGGHQPEHAWFAGYAPADHPRVAFVVVLEHAGNADTAAGPVARRLVERMNELGYFTAGKSLAAGGIAPVTMLK